ncbi:zinc finger protein 260-like isoform X1 [Hippocampus comes]|uniref:Zinc finger protein 260-like n=2 Tax=Hippocampus comes TaxID=109280 RepID=A0A3Q2Y322_HIPCM|nr:PREDICTED: zinc finger protein 260-like isoform X1 [Hippocampus comes]
MCKVRILRTLMKQRLNVAVDEIFELFERTIAEYEEELCRTKEEKERQGELLHAVLKPQVLLHRAVIPTSHLHLLPSSGEDIQQMSADSQEEKQQEEETAEPPHIKKEEDGESLQCPKDDADINTFVWTGVHVKCEVDEGQSSQLRHTPHENLSQRAITESDGVLCEASQTGYIAPLSDMDDVSNSSDTDHSDTEPLETQNKSKGRLTHHAVRNKFNCSQCEKTFANKRALKSHAVSHMGVKPFACSLCEKRFSFKRNVKRHMRRHTGEKPFTCSVCARRFHDKDDMKTHMTIHTGVKPFPCAVCGKTFSRQSYLRTHIRTHTGEKPFTCAVCAKRFARTTSLRRHARKHSAEKPLGCSGERMTQQKLTGNT